MTKKIAFITLLLLTKFGYSQVIGTVTDSKNKALPFVNIFIENTYNGTTSNTDGYYELNIKSTGTYTIVFTYLGYKTIKQEVNISQLPYTLNMVLEEEKIALDEVLINSKDNPANAIIKNAIAKRKFNLQKIKSYTADFYSRGMIKIEDAPESFLGQEVEIEGLDSSRTGIIYLSETISKIQYLFPNRFKENITASKVSGDDNGFSFNNARDVNFNLYKNTVEFGSNTISPIANNAFAYYTYRLEGIFYDEFGHLINKITVTPKRKKDPVYSGSIYIVEDQWNIYAAELSITGEQARIPGANTLTLKQEFSYSKTNNIWALLSQNLSFDYGLLGFNGNGIFTAVYSNYTFNSGIDKSNFNKALVTFEPQANKKDSTFWNTIRPVPLTQEELKDYTKKDSIQTLKKSKPYLDSLDREQNKLKWSSALGYTYQNSHKDYRLGYSLPISDIQFNTVQGFHAKANVFFTKNYDDYKRFLRVNTNFNYGFSDERLRVKASVQYKFNNVSKATFVLSGGEELKQFNNANPISPLGNTIASLYFEENYMKLYQRQFAQLSFSEELFNGFRAYANISYENRQAVFNTTDQVFFPQDDKTFSSNNPINPFSTTPAFENHNILKLNLSARINFDQSYLSYPDSKYNISNEKFPTLLLGYEKGFGATNSNYDFDQIKARLYQSFDIANKGEFNYNIRTGKFFNANNIAFIDFQHFNGNQLPFSSKGNYTDVFNNLGYYNLSTNDAYFEFHAEHDFNGFILGKLPLINSLNFNLVIGAHQLSIPNQKPYQEFTIGLDNIGWGKWRFLRVDYIRSYQSGFLSDTLVFGLKFF